MIQHSTAPWSYNRAERLILNAAGVKIFKMLLPAWGSGRPSVDAHMEGLANVELVLHAASLLKTVRRIASGESPDPKAEAAAVLQAMGVSGR